MEKKEVVKRSEEKKYTIRQLLASEDAMKDLLHERLLAVRDDLNFAINGKNNAMASAVGKLDKRVDAMEREILSVLRRIEAKQEDLSDRIDGVYERMGPPWWRSASYWRGVGYRIRVMFARRRGK